jgi:hypothetical protein
MTMTTDQPTRREPNRDTLSALKPEDWKYVGAVGRFVASTLETADVTFVLAVILNHEDLDYDDAVDLLLGCEPRLASWDPHFAWGELPDERKAAGMYVALRIAEHLTPEDFAKIRGDRAA